MDYENLGQRGRNLILNLAQFVGVGAFPKDSGFLVLVGGTRDGCNPCPG